MTAAWPIADVVALAPGQASGAVLVLTEPLSFWGGLDSATGRIIDRWHPQHGESLAGRLLVMTAGRGSSSGSSVLAESLRLGTGPCGIVLARRDAIVVVGAMIAAELYDLRCPVVLAARPEDWPRIVAARSLAITAQTADARLEAIG